MSCSRKQPWPSVESDPALLRFPGLRPWLPGCHPDLDSSPQGLHLNGGYRPLRGQEPSAGSTAKPMSRGPAIMFASTRPAQQVSKRTGGPSCTLAPCMPTCDRLLWPGRGACVPHCSTRQQEGVWQPEEPVPVQACRLQAVLPVPGRAQRSAGLATSAQEDTFSGP